MQKDAQYTEVVEKISITESPIISFTPRKYLKNLEHFTYLLVYKQATQIINRRD